MVEVINQFRYEQESNLYESFPTMVAFGQHGASSHYQPSKTTNSKLFGNSTIVIDSGGQYRGRVLPTKQQFKVAIKNMLVSTVAP